MSIDRFLIADNPMREGGTRAIIHTQQPISIIVVDEGHITTKWPHGHYEYDNANGITEPFTLSLYHCFSTSFDGEENAIITDKMLNKAWHWYMAYLKWEDSQEHNYE